MNSIITDNSVRAMHLYLRENLVMIYDDREAGNIVSELFRQFLGWTRSDTMLNADTRLSESDMLKFHFALKRLKSGEPLQYVISNSWFYGRPFFVNNSVLIPRPETEELVSHVIKRNNLNSPKILDIGTGSGCIAITLRKEIAASEVVACDVSATALVVASKNAGSMKADVRFEHLDILHEIPHGGPWNIIVSNPPYIPEKEAGTMEDRVTRHEPHIALFTPDDDPLLFYRRILSISKTSLQKDGFVFCEIHERMQMGLENMLIRDHVTNFEFVSDMQGRKRFLYYQL